MAKPPALRSLSVEVFEGVEGAEQIASVLGPFVQDVGAALDDLMLPNRAAQFETLTFTTTSGSGVAVKFKNRLPSAPRGVSIAQLRPVHNYDLLLLAVGNPIWRFGQDGMIYIEHIGGLTSSTAYKVTFKVE
jgi:hypothetical protein